MSDDFFSTENTIKSWNESITILESRIFRFTSAKKNISEKSTINLLNKYIREDKREVKRIKKIISELNDKRFL